MLTVATALPRAGWARAREDAVARGAVLTSLTLVGVVGGYAAAGLGRAGLGALLFALAFLAGGVPAAREAARELWRARKLDVDLLMVVAAVGAASVGQAGDGAILLFLFSLSNTLQDWAFSRTRDAIRALMALAPECATVVDAVGTEREVRVADLHPGDVLVVRPGERFAADAQLLAGYTSVDESALTGESRPVDKTPGEPVYSGTLNGEGVVRARVERGASESRLARLIELVEQAQAEKSPTERFAERLEGPYTAIVLASVPILFLVFHAVVGLAVGAAWYRAMTFLVVASPCAVVISTPAAVLSAMAAGARAGTLFKSGAALEELAKVDVVAFDKTGTLTEGRMSLVRVIPLEGTEPDARALAAALERHGEHPVARAIAGAWTGPLDTVADVRAVRGMGIRGDLGGDLVWAGSRRMAAAQGAEPDGRTEALLHELEAEGTTTVLLGRGSRLLAVLGVADRPRADAAAAVAALRRRGLRVVMLTGDREPVARYVAELVGIDEVQAELLPERKLAAVRDLRRTGRVAMVGDGVNDAPALAAADLGISMGSGTDVSLESADLVLIRNDLARLDGAIDLARRAAGTIRFNLAFALAIIAIVGALALLGRVPLPLGVVAHEGGTLFVVAAGLRLLRRR